LLTVAAIERVDVVKCEDRRTVVGGLFGASCSLERRNASNAHSATNSDEHKARIASNGEMLPTGVV
jgi:hypothetical protein